MLFPAVGARALDVLESRVDIVLSAYIPGLPYVLRHGRRMRRSAAGVLLSISIGFLMSLFGCPLASKGLHTVSSSSIHFPRSLDIALRTARILLGMIMSSGVEET